MNRAVPPLVLALVLAFVAAVAAWGLLPVASAGDAPATPATTAGSARIPSDVLDAARRIPLQDGGRVKPLDTYAQFALLALNHRRTCETAEGDTIPAIEWLLDVLFRPERARKHRCFSVDTSEVLDAVGLGHEGKKKRDRYSYAELAPGREALARLSSGLAGKDPKDLGAVEGAIVDLSHDLAAFERLARLADFARASVPLAAGSKLSDLFGGKDEVPVTEVFARASDVAKLAEGIDPHGTGSDSAEGKALQDLKERVLDLARSAGELALVPPTASVDRQPEWYSLQQVAIAKFGGEALLPEFERVYAAFVGMATQASDPAAFGAHVREFRETTSTMAEQRGEYGKIGLEVALYRLDPFDRAVWLYVLAFLAIAVSWLRPTLKGPTWAAWGLLFAAVGLQVAGIAMRCVVRERPPISTLYETMLFISALGAIVSLVIEAISRRGIALALAPVVGGLTLFLANRYEVSKGEDTMPQLVAVLDTNFWLWLHVTCINIGYMGGLLTALVGHVHVIGRAVGLKRGNDDFYRAVSRINYGMLGFALLFSVVGTILGGIWANESWGRFWGWDPKENGALLICLAQLAILHARLGGLIKPFGFAMASIAQGMVVAFSWWHVNLLGIGLHAYGFTAGIMTGLMTFYAVETAILGLGFTIHLLGRSYGSTPPPPVPA